MGRNEHRSDHTSRARRAAAALAVGGATGGLLLPGALGTTAAGAVTAPQIRVSRACYVNAASAAPITVTGSGWTAGDSVGLRSADGSLFGSAIVGPDGAFAVELPGTVAAAGRAEQLERLTATDAGNPGTGTPGNGATATTSFLITNLSVSVKPSAAPISQRVTFTFSGFRPGRFIYAHFVHRGRAVVRERFGRAHGACGTLRVRAVQYPGGRPRYSSYTVQFDDAARYSTHTRPSLVARLTTF